MLLDSVALSCLIGQSKNYKDSPMLDSQEILSTMKSFQTIFCCLALYCFLLNLSMHADATSWGQRIGGALKSPFRNFFSHKPSVQPVKKPAPPKSREPKPEDPVEGEKVTVEEERARPLTAVRFGKHRQEEEEDLWRLGRKRRFGSFPYQKPKLPSFPPRQPRKTWPFLDNIEEPSEEILSGSSSDVEVEEDDDMPPLEDPEIADIIGTTRQPEPTPITPVPSFLETYLGGVKKDLAALKEKPSEVLPKDVTPTALLGAESFIDRATVTNPSTSIAVELPMTDVPPVVPLGQPVSSSTPAEKSSEQTKVAQVEGEPAVPEQVPNVEEERVDLERVETQDEPIEPQILVTERHDALVPLPEPDVVPHQPEITSTSHPSEPAKTLIHLDSSVASTAWDDLETISETIESRSPSPDVPVASVEEHNPSEGEPSVLLTIDHAKNPRIITSDPSPISITPPETPLYSQALSEPSLPSPGSSMRPVVEKRLVENDEVGLVTFQPYRRSLKKSSPKSVPVSRSPSPASPLILSSPSSSPRSPLSSEIPESPSPSPQSSPLIEFRLGHLITGSSPSSSPTKVSPEPPSPVNSIKYRAPSSPESPVEHPPRLGSAPSKRKKKTPEKVKKPITGKRRSRSKTPKPLRKDVDSRDSLVTLKPIAYKPLQSPPMGSPLTTQSKNLTHKEKRELLEKERLQKIEEQRRKAAEKEKLQEEERLRKEVERQEKITKEKEHRVEVCKRSGQLPVKETACRCYACEHFKHNIKQSQKGGYTGETFAFKQAKLSSPKGKRSLSKSPSPVKPSARQNPKPSLPKVPPTGPPSGRSPSASPSKPVPLGSSSTSRTSSPRPLNSPSTPSKPSPPKTLKSQ